jgi:caffeyl-CoA reductase-Etf complex subunit CarE
MDNRGVLVSCEYAEGKLAPIAIEILGIGGKLAKDLGQELSAVLIGQNISEMAKEAIAYGANKVYVVDDPLLKDYLTDSYLGVIEKVIKQSQPQIVLLGQTPIGRDLTPRLAFRLNTGATMDTIALAIDPSSKRMIQTKPVYGGNAQVIQVCDVNPQIATVRSKAMSPAVLDANRKGEVIAIPAGIDPAAVRTKILERKTEAAAGVKLEDAKIIVTGGRGIGGPDGFKQLAELAGIFKGALGASRPPCDNKWIPDTHQVGLTGKIVSPDVYIAVALSGSSQHLSGCSGSKVIVAINKDPEANIFKVANFGIVGDWKKVIPSFTAKCKELVG